MDRDNLSINNMVVKNLNISDGDVILEIGFGSGLTINRILKYNNNIKLFGIEISRIMLMRARLINMRFIKKRILTLYEESIVKTSFQKNSFNKIFTVHTIYFWGNLELGLREINRILCNGGFVYIAFRDKVSLESRKHVRGDFNIYNTNSVIENLKKEGFRISDIVYNEFDKNEFCVIAEKIRDGFI